MSDSVALVGAVTAPKPASFPWRADTKALVIAFSVFLLISIWGAFFHAVDVERDLTLRTTIKENANLARAFEEHIIRTIRSVDQVALFVKDQYERHGTHLDLERYTSEGRIAAEIYNQVGVIDEHGMLAMSNVKNFKRLDLSDREHFKVHVARDSGEIFVGKPVLGRASGKWSIQFSRRINKSDGSFGGVIVVSVDPFYFSEFYRQVDLGTNGVVTLVGRDAIVRARQSGADTAVGQDMSNTRLFGELARAPVGSYVATSTIDGANRIVAYRALSRYPFVVMVGSAYNEAFADFHSRRTRYLTVSLLMGAAVVGFALALVTAINRRRRAHEALQVAMERAESANRLKSEFLASMSHELRTPLNGILGFADLLQVELDDPEQRKFAELIYSSGHHLLDLVNSILDLAKIEAGRMVIDPIEIDLQPLLDEVVNVHAVAARAKGIECRLSLGTELPPTFTADRTKTVQILNNLLHNAIKFTDHGWTELSVRRDGEYVRFEVRDTGPGIVAEKQVEVFDKFVQCEHFITRRHEGTGLGLALAKELVELMGGSIGLTSELGAGSAFHFTLPLRGRGTEAGK